MKISTAFYLAIIALAFGVIGCSTSQGAKQYALASDHPGKYSDHVIAGEPEDWDKAPFAQEASFVKVSKYGALWTEYVPGRLLTQISPPPEPGAPAWWIVPDSHDPRVMYGEGDSVNDGARVLIEYNVSGEADGAITNEVFVPAGVARPIQGAIKIASSAGTVSIYGFYTKPVTQDE